MSSFTYHHSAISRLHSELTVILLSNIHITSVVPKMPFTEKRKKSEVGLLIAEVFEEYRMVILQNVPQPGFSKIFFFMIRLNGCILAVTLRK